MKYKAHIPENTSAMESAIHMTKGETTIYHVSDIKNGQS